MKIYNSMTRRKEELTPLTPGKLTIYACGPTVYNYMHMGNGRQICVFDVLRRYLMSKGWAVKYAQNFTDIDDKIIRKAAEEGTDYQSISRQYMAAYEEDAKNLNVLPADLHPRATDYMPQIIRFVQELVDQGHAYAVYDEGMTDGDVYFSTESFAQYGKLSGQPLEELKAGARIAVTEKKHSPVDFAVWKAAKPGEPYWDSPWGKGRPGWHIECSAMVKEIFGNTVDIHGGGQDLIFPHHENEIAQSESISHVPMADYWVHNGLLRVDHKKMGKSLGNSFMLREVAKTYGYEPIRYLLISSHYRSQLNYSEEAIEYAAASLERLYHCKENLQFAIEHSEDAQYTKEEQQGFRELNPYKDRFNAAMEDDLNTADALAAVFELVRRINTDVVNVGMSKTMLEKTLKLFLSLCDILGLLYERKTEDLDSEVERLIQRREEARKTKDWKTADQIRDQLQAMQIALEDTPNGVKWKKI